MVDEGTRQWTNERERRHHRDVAGAHSEPHSAGGEWFRRTGDDGRRRGEGDQAHPMGEMEAMEAMEAVWAVWAMEAVWAVWAVGGTAEQPAIR
jgi:hypothetical protein